MSGAESPQVKKGLENKTCKCDLCETEELMLDAAYHLRAQVIEKCAESNMHS
jgi:hypothetical protein